jgi:hypothetical protein
MKWISVLLRAGNALAEEHTILPYQYFLVFRPGRQ